MGEVLYAELSQLAGALNSPTRLQALHLLIQAPRSIEALAALLGESHANTAAHMKALRAAGLVTAERRGKHVYQRAVEPAAPQLLLALCAAGETLRPALQQLQDSVQKTASSVQPRELVQLMETRRVVLLDLRPSAEFEAGHLPGARSLPASAVDARARELPGTRRILAYCRGKYCQAAQQGVRALRSAGLRAERLGFGVGEWRAQGHSLEIGAEAARNASRAPDVNHP